MISEIDLPVQKQG